MQTISENATALVADALALMADAAALLGWHRAAFLLHLVAAAVRWAGPLLL